MHKTICILIVGVGIGALLMQWFSQGTIAGIFPFLLALACPLMMVFMMHGAHSPDNKTSDAKKEHNH